MSRLPPALAPESSAIEDAQIGLVVDAGLSLHALATPAHRLEAVMERLSARFGMEGRFFCTPTAIFAAFGAPPTQQTYLLRAAPADYDLGRLVELDGLVGEVLAGRRSPEDARSAVAALAAERPRFGAGLRVLGYTAVAASGAFLFGGGALEAALASAVAVGVGALDLLAARSAALGRLFVPLAVLGAAFLLTAATARWPSLAVQVALIAAILPLLPGLGLTTAMNEIATGHLVSGTSRLASSVVTFLLIAFGFAVGGQLGALLPDAGPGSAVTKGATLAIAAAAIPVAAVGLAIVLRARPRDFVVVALACVVAFFAARLGAALMGPELGAALGAFGLAGFSNGYARLARRPAAVPLVPGILLLVPGSIGFRSLSSFLADDVLVAVDAAFSVGLIGIALVAGLLVANLALPPRGDL